jgi:hypothetical protein
LLKQPIKVADRIRVLLEVAPIAGPALLAVVVIGACGLHTRAVTIRDTLMEGFSHFVTSMIAPFASGWSVAGGACTHWKSAALHGAHPKRTLRWMSSNATTPAFRTTGNRWSHIFSNGNCKYSH